MAVEVQLDTTSLDRLARDISPEAMDKAVRAAAFDAEGGAKALAPVDTGYLRSGIRARRVGMAYSEVTTEAEYAPFVELGTSRQRAQPYLGPAAQEAIDRLVSALEAKLRRAR